MNDSKTPIYALLIGIDEWINPKLPSLSGCVNDVEIMEKSLRERFDVPAENIKILRNSEATHEAIKLAFREHLIETARRWQNSHHDSDHSSPAFLLHYAGHGSQATDPTNTQPNGMDQTIVPHDSRTEGVYDIKNWELRQLLEELVQYSDNVTVFLDCCHSGRGLRDVEATLRTCEPDLRPQPSSRPLQNTATRGTGDDGEVGGSDHTLLAACRSHEYAQEYRVQEGDQSRSQGAMTYFLVQEMAQLPLDRPVTYRELYERVRYQVNSRYSNQMPQCEGDRDRILFGGARIAHEPMLNVVDCHDDTFWIDAGATQGLTVGTTLRVFPPGTQTVDSESKGVATLRIDKVRAVRSQCQKEPGGGPVDLHSRVAVDRINYGNMRRQVALAVESKEVRAELEQRLSGEDAAAYLELVSSNAVPQFQIQWKDNQLEILDQAKTRLVAPFPRDDTEGLVNDLKAMVRYFNALDLRNREPTDLRVSIEMYAVATETELEGSSDATETKRKVYPVQDIPTLPDGEPVVELRKPIAIKVTNHSSRALYCEILSFGYEYNIVPLFDVFHRGGRVRVDAGQTAWLGREEQDRLAFDIDDEEEEKRFSQGREFLKVIATVEEADFATLAQGPLKTPYSKRRAAGGSPLDRLFEQAMSGGNQRALGPAKKQVENAWTTAELQYVVRGAGKHAHSEPPEDQTKSASPLAVSAGRPE